MPSKRVSLKGKGADLFFGEYLPAIADGGADETRSIDDAAAADAIEVDAAVEAPIALEIPNERTNETTRQGSDERTIERPIEGTNERTKRPSSDRSDAACAPLDDQLSVGRPSEQSVVASNERTNGRAPTATAPVEPDAPLAHLRADPIGGARRGAADAEPSPDGRTNGWSPVADAGRAMIGLDQEERRRVRHSFDIFEDQLYALAEIQTRRFNAERRKPKLGELVQAALDQYIAANERTGERAKPR
jgi:hypothetical protein